MSATGSCRFCGQTIIDIAALDWIHEATGDAQCRVSATPEGLVLVTPGPDSIAHPIRVDTDWRGRRSVVVACPYCERHHRHGAIAGVVVAHCVGPARVTRHYRRPPHVSRSYVIPAGPLEALLAADPLNPTEPPQ